MLGGFDNYVLAVNLKEYVADKKVVQLCLSQLALDGLVGLPSPHLEFDTANEQWNDLNSTEALSSLSLLLTVHLAKGRNANGNNDTNDHDKNDYESSHDEARAKIQRPCGKRE